MGCCGRCAFLLASLIINHVDELRFIDSAFWRSSYFREVIVLGRLFFDEVVRHLKVLSPLNFVAGYVVRTRSLWS